MLVNLPNTGYLSILRMRSVRQVAPRSGHLKINKINMKIEDIAGIGKVLPIDKLVGVLEKAFGRAFKGYFDKKDADTEEYRLKKLADAKAYELEVVERARKNAELASREAESLFLERTQQRLLFREIKKQKNIESVAQKALENLKEEEFVTDEPLNEDWVTRFFNIIEDISDEEVQEIWSRILSGEIKQPKSYSLRTLELLKNLSKDEAKVFLKIAKFAINSNGTTFLIKGANKDVLKDFGISFHEISLIQELGVLNPGDFVQFKLPSLPDVSKTAFEIGDVIVIAEKEANSPKKSIPVKVFNRIGVELLNLVTTTADFKYIQYLGRELKSKHIKVSYGQILERNNDSIIYDDELLEIPDLENQSEDEG